MPLNNIKSLNIIYHIYLSIYRSIYRSIDLSFYRSIYLSIYLSIYRSIYLSIYSYLSILIYLFLSIYSYLSILIYLFLSIYSYLSILIYLFLSIYSYLIKSQEISIRSSFLVPEYAGLHRLGRRIFALFAHPAPEEFVTHSSPREWGGAPGVGVNHQNWRCYPLVI